MVEYLDRITPGMDTETAAAFQKSLTKQGFEFKLGAKVTGAKASKTRVELTFRRAGRGRKRGPDHAPADYVLVAIGRRPYTKGLGLESVGITPDKRGVIANDHYKTGVARRGQVIGDVTSGPMLAHKAKGTRRWPVSRS